MAANNVLEFFFGAALFILPFLGAVLAIVVFILLLKVRTQQQHIQTLLGIEHHKSDPTA